MKKKIFFAFAILFALAMFPMEASGSSMVRVLVDGEQINFSNQQPAVIDGRTLVPVRGVFEHIGFNVDWNRATQTVTLTRARDVVVITLGSRQFLTNNNVHMLDVPAQAINSSTMLPIRSVLESVGYHVGWDSPTQTVIISSVPLHLASPVPPLPTPFAANTPASRAAVTMTTEDVVRSRANGGAISNEGLIVFELELLRACRQ